MTDDLYRNVTVFFLASYFTCSCISLTGDHSTEARAALSYSSLQVSASRNAAVYSLPKLHFTYCISELMSKLVPILCRITKQNIHLQFTVCSICHLVNRHTPAALQ